LNDAAKNQPILIQLDLAEQVSVEELNLVERYLGEILAQVVLQNENEQAE